MKQMGDLALSYPIRLSPSVFAVLDDVLERTVVTTVVLLLLVVSVAIVVIEGIDISDKRYTVISTSLVLNVLYFILVLMIFSCR